MRTVVIEPRDSLLVRDARPFSADPGARARTLEFPAPSTVAGVIRTRLGTGADGLFQAEQRAALLATEIRGPLLCSLDERGDLEEWWLPAPSDAVLFEAEDRALTRERLAPFNPPPGAQTDLDPAAVLPTGFGRQIKGKPSGGASHRFWAWGAAGGYRDWLVRPQAGLVSSDGWALGGLPRETRVHVAVQGETRTAAEGQLFSTEGLRFQAIQGGSQELGPARLSRCRRLALTAAVDHPDLRSVAGLGAFGGERRLCAFRLAASGFPAPPEELVERIVADRAARLVLITPGLFEAGWRPSPARLGPPATALVAAVVGRPLTVGGWDLARREPKPTRRAAPSGSVWFVRLPADLPAEDVRAWVRDRWFASLSDQPQDRRDGFGLSLVGSWDGRISSETEGAR